MLRHRVEALEIRRKLGARHQLVAARNVHDRKRALLRFIFFTQLCHHRFNGVFVKTFVDESNVASAQRRITGEQQCLNDLRQSHP